MTHPAVRLIVKDKLVAAGVTPIFMELEHLQEVRARAEALGTMQSKRAIPAHSPLLRTGSCLEQRCTGGAGRCHAYLPRAHWWCLGHMLECNAFADVKAEHHPRSAWFRALAAQCAWIHKPTHPPTHPPAYVHWHTHPKSHYLRVPNGCRHSTRPAALPPCVCAALICWPWPSHRPSRRAASPAAPFRPCPSRSWPWWRRRCRPARRPL